MTWFNQNNNDPCIWYLCVCVIVTILAFVWLLRHQTTVAFIYIIIAMVYWYKSFAKKI